MQLIISALIVLCINGVAAAQNPTRVSGDIRTSCSSVPGQGCGSLREKCAAHRCGLYSQQLDHGPDARGGGSADGSNGGPAALAAGIAGIDVTFVPVALNTTPIVILGNVSRMEDLKGEAIGITRFGSNTDISARFAIRKFGLQPDKDLALVQWEDYPGIMGGMQSGRIAAGALADPFTDRAKKLGYKEIVDVAALGLEFPSVGIVAKKSYVRDNIDTVQRFVRAYTEAIALYKNNPEMATKVKSKNTGIKDPAILASTVGFYAPKLARVPYPTIGGMRFVLEQIATRDPRAKNANAESFMDVRFVKRLEDDGFINRLYRK